MNVCTYISWTYVLTLLACEPFAPNERHRIGFEIDQQLVRVSYGDCDIDSDIYVHDGIDIEIDI